MCSEEKRSSIQDMLNEHLQFLYETAQVEKVALANRYRMSSDHTVGSVVLEC